MSYRKEFLKELIKDRNNYKDIIDFCCDSLIMNNYIVQELAKKEIYFDNYCGSECYYLDNNGNEITSKQAEEMSFDEYYEKYYDIYQYFIIDSTGAERLKEYTNEIVLYNEDLDLYLLCVCHFGSSWTIVSSNWKELDEVSEDD